MENLSAKNLLLTVIPETPATMFDGDVSLKY